MNKTYKYAIIEDVSSPDRYGISILSEKDIFTIQHITPSRRKIRCLLERLKSGGVTAVTLRDVVEDFLAETTSL